MDEVLLKMRDLVKHPLTPKEFEAYEEDFKVVDEYKRDKINWAFVQDFYPRGGYSDEAKHKVPRSYRICSNQAGIESVELFNEDLHVWSVVVLNTPPEINISRESWDDHVDE